MQIQIRHLIATFITLFQHQEVILRYCAEFSSGSSFFFFLFYTSKQLQLSCGNKRLCVGKQMNAMHRGWHTMLLA